MVEVGNGGREMFETEYATQRQTFQEEFIAMLKLHELEYDERYACD